MTFLEELNGLIASSIEQAESAVTNAVANNKFRSAVPFI
jgi:hypothetical protein